MLALPSGAIHHIQAKLLVLLRWNSVPLWVHSICGSHILFTSQVCNLSNRYWCLQLSTKPVVSNAWLSEIRFGQIVHGSTLLFLGNNGLSHLCCQFIPQENESPARQIIRLAAIIRANFYHGWRFIRHILFLSWIAREKIWHLRYSHWLLPSRSRIWQFCRNLDHAKCQLKQEN